MTTTKTRLSTGDLQRELRVSRSVLDRLLRDWPRELPQPEGIGGSRTWPVDSLPDFREVIRRDQERPR